MEKKIYTTPALSVEEFQMTEVICTSPVTKVSTTDDVNIGYGGGSNTNARANNRGDGIWDED